MELGAGDRWPAGSGRSAVNSGGSVPGATCGTAVPGVPAEHRSGFVLVFIGGIDDLSTCGHSGTRSDVAARLFREMDEPSTLDVSLVDGCDSHHGAQHQRDDRL